MNLLSALLMMSSASPALPGTGKQPWTVVGTNSGCIAQIVLGDQQIFFRRMLSSSGNTFGYLSPRLSSLKGLKNVGFNFYFGTYKVVGDLPSPEDGIWTYFAEQGQQISTGVPDTFLDKLARYDTIAVDDGISTIELASLRGSADAVARFRQCWNNLIGARRY